MHTKSATKLLQIFGIYKDLTVKIEFIRVFSGKYLLFAQLCDCTFEGGASFRFRKERHPPRMVIILAIRRAEGAAKKSLS